MKKQLLVYLLSALITATVIGVYAQDQVPAPAFEDGDTWQFNVTRKGGGIAVSTDITEGLYELVFSQGKVKVYQMSGSQKAEMAIQPDGPGQGLMSMVAKSEELQDLKFPLSAGQKWTYEYERTPPGARRSQRRSVEVTVVGLEQINTPAGTFRAYKLVGNASWGKNAGSTTTFFFSPETRSVVKRVVVNTHNSATAETELIKFIPGN
jgi:hypothetical protein